MTCQTTKHRSDTGITEKPSLNFTKTKKLKALNKHTKSETTEVLKLKALNSVTKTEKKTQHINEPETKVQKI